MLLRLLNPQGIAGLAVSIALALLLVVQKAETRQWQRKSGQFEQLYQGARTAFSATVPAAATVKDISKADGTTRFSAPTCTRSPVTCRPSARRSVR